MHTPKSLIAATLAVLFLTACGSSGIGDVLGGGGGTGAGSSNYELRGTVDYVDTSSQSVYLTNVSGYGNMLSNGNGGSGRSVRVYYDNQTAVEHQGQSHRPEDLERGDEVVVRVDESGNRLLANSIAVTHDVTAGSSLPSSSQTYGAPVRGTVRYIDASRRTIELDRNTGGSVVLDFENSTPVHFNNQSYRVTDLERGDEVEIRVRDLGGNRWIAQDVTVIRSVSGTNNNNNGTWNDNSSTARSTIRGTVASIDRSRRTFQLQGANWISGFNSGAGGSSMGTITVQYDDNTSVDVNGSLHPMAGLERGDIVDVQVSGSGSSYFAQRVFLVRDVNNR